MISLSRHMKRWWSKELDKSRRRLNKLSEEAHRHQALDDYSLEAELLSEQGRYTKAMQDAQTQHWEDFLDQAMEQELWIANKYATRPTMWGHQRGHNKLGEVQSFCEHSFPTTTTESGSTREL